MTTTHHLLRRRPVEVQHRTLDTFVFRGGRALSPTEVATLRLLAAAGTLPLCVVVGSGRAPDPAWFRAGPPCRLQLRSPHDARNPRDIASRRSAD